MPYLVGVLVVVIIAAVAAAVWVSLRGVCEIAGAQVTV